MDSTRVLRHQSSLRLPGPKQSRLRRRLRPWHLLRRSRLRFTRGPSSKKITSNERRVAIESYVGPLPRRGNRRNGSPLPVERSTAGSCVVAVYPIDDDFGSPAGWVGTTT